MLVDGDGRNVATRAALPDLEAQGIASRALPVQGDGVGHVAGPRVLRAGEPVPVLQDERFPVGHRSGDDVPHRPLRRVGDDAFIMEVVHSHGFGFVRYGFPGGIPDALV